MKTALRLTLALLVCTVLCLCIAPIARAEGNILGSGFCGAQGNNGENLTWKLDNEGLLTISGTGAMMSFSSGDDSLTLVDASSRWKQFKTDIRTVVISQGVTSVGNHAFYQCSGITSVTIPSSMNSIGKWAFAGCNSLSNGNIYYSGTESEWNALRNSIGNYNAPLLNATFHPNSTGPDEHLYNSEVSGILRSGDNWHIQWKIWYNSENRANSFLKIYYEGDDENIGSLELHSELGNGFTMPWLTDTYGFQKTDFEKISIEGGANHLFNIISNQFNGYSNARIVQLVRVGLLQSGAFSDCTNMETFIFDECLTYIGDRAFKNDAKLSSLRNLSIDSGIETVGDEAFSGCSSLTKIEIMDHVKTMGTYVFSGCSELNQIEYPSQLTSIPVGTFSNCTGLLIFIMPNTITAIEDFAFQNCSNLQKSIIAENVTSVGDSAFSGCDLLVIHCYSDTYIYTYAINHDIPVKLIRTIGHVVYSGDKNGADRYFRFEVDEEIENLVRSKDSYSYNPRLAHFLSMMARSAYNLDLLEANYKELGFSHTAKQFFNDPQKVFAPYYIGKKTAEDGRSSIVMITIKGSDSITDPNNAAQWLLSNFNISESFLHDGWHTGFSNCAEIIFNDLEAFMGGSIQTTGVTYVITGHSLGAGTANLLSMKLIGEAGVSPRDIYDYNFACPNTALQPAGEGNWNPSGTYSNIININNKYDMVSYLPGALSEVLAGSNSNIASIIASGGYSKWKKYGTSYWFDDGFYLPVDVLNLNLDAHDMRAYVDYLAKQYDQSRFVASEFEAEALLACCPVDVIIYGSEGDPIAGVVNDEACYYDYPIGERAIILTSEDRKLFYFKEPNWKIKITATDDGEMDCAFASMGMAEGETHQVCSYQSIPLTLGKTMTSTVGGNISVSDVKLYVVDENDDLISEVHEDGTETPIYVIDSGSCGENLTWTLYGDGLLTISGEGNMADFIDSEMGLLDNVAWRQYKSTITSVVIKAGVTSISSAAFLGCSNLVDITIPNSVESIGNSAFYGCIGLTKVTIPAGVTSIDTAAFMGCTGLKSITIPAGVTRIGNIAFNFCSKLSSIDFPNTLQSIGQEAFSNCSSLTYVYIPISVSSIGAGAFSNCTNLVQITVDYYSTIFCTPNGILFSKDMSKLYCYPAGNTDERYYIPSEVERIGQSAFSGAANLKEVIFPDNLIGIDKHAFDSCTGLLELNFPNSMTELGDAAFEDCAGVTRVKLPNLITTIPYETFQGCSSLEAISVPLSVTKIESWAFSGCTSLSDVYYAGTTVEQWSDIDIQTDWWDTGSSDGNDPIRYATIHYGASFYTVHYDGSWGSELKTPGEPVMLSSSSNSPNAYFIGWAESPNAVKPDYPMPGGVYTRDADVTLYAIYIYADLILPATITEIGEEAFAGGAFRFVQLPKHAVSIGPRAFADCPNLVCIFIHDKVTQIADDAFGNAENITIFGGAPYQGMKTVAETYAEAHDFTFIPVYWRIPIYVQPPTPIVIG